TCFPPPGRGPFELGSGRLHTPGGPMGRKIQSARTPHERPQSTNSEMRAPLGTGRRRFLAQTVGIVGAATGGMAPQAAAQDVPAVPPWMQTMGTPMRGYGTPSKFEEKVARTAASG